MVTVQRVGAPLVTGEPHWSQFNMWEAPLVTFQCVGSPTGHSSTCGEPQVTVLRVGSPRSQSYVWGAPGHSSMCGELQVTVLCVGSSRSQFYVWGAPGHSSTCGGPQGSPRSQFYVWGAPGEPRVTVLRVGDPQTDKQADTDRHRQRQNLRFRIPEFEVSNSRIRGFKFQNLVFEFQNLRGAWL